MKDVPDRPDFDSSHHSLRAEAFASLDRSVGSMASSSAAEAWREKLATHCDEIYAREGANLQLVSERICTETAENLLESELRKPLEGGEFDNDFAIFEAAVDGLLSAYNKRAKGPCKVPTLLSLLTAPQKIPSMHRMLNQRVNERHAKQTMELEQSVVREIAAKKQVEVKLEGKLQLLEQIKATSDQHLKTIENLEAEKKRVQEAKDKLDSDFHTAEADMRASGKAIEKYKRESEEMKNRIAKMEAKEVANMEMLASMSEDQMSLTAELQKWKQQADPRIRTRAFDDESMEKLGFKQKIAAKLAESERKREAKKAAAAAAAGDTAS